MTGVKYDEDKPRMDLIPPEMMQGLAEVLTYGANKYGDRNWEEGMDYNRVIAATYRHLVAWQAGEPTDSESGLSHIAHALANLAFLLTYEKRGMIDADDDRTNTRRNAPGLYPGGYIFNNVLDNIPEAFRRVPQTYAETLEDVDKMRGK